MNKILFDASSPSPISDLVAIAPGDCLLVNAWGLLAGQTATVYRVLVGLGNIPAQQSGSCAPPPAVQGATIQTEIPYAPCNAAVEVGQTPIENLTSILLQQPGFYRLHLTPAALGTAIVEAVVLTGADACAAAATQCCCEPQAFWDGSSTDPCLVITPGGPLGHSPVFSLDACCLIESFPPNVAPTSLDELIVLSGGACFRSTIGQVFANALFCEALVAFPTLGPAAGDRLSVVDAGDNCKTVDAETLVEFFETPWTGVSANANLTITPGGVNGHGPTFNYDLCADLSDLPVCACEPTTGDLIPIIQGGNCTLATFPEVNFCVQVGALVVGAPIVGDMVPVREAGGACKRVPVSALVAFPLLAPNGSCAAPSYSFTSSPDSGIFYDPAGVGSVVIGDDNCTDSIAIGASITIRTNNVTRLVLTSAGEWSIGGATGAVGQAITSAGPGLPPTWATPFSLQLYDESPVAPVAPSATGNNAFTIGSGGVAAAPNSFSLGSLATVTILASNGIALGTLSNVSAANGIAIGQAATVSGASGIAIGANSDATQPETTAVGDDSQATGVSASALGGNTVASGAFSLAAGYGAIASQLDTVAIGHGVNNGTASTIQIGSSNTNKFAYSAVGEFSLLGTGAMFLLSNYTVATLPTAANSGGFIYVTDESGGAVPAFSDTVNWRRVTDRAIVT